MTVIDILQIITPTVVDLVTPTALLEVQQTPVVTSTGVTQVQDKVNVRLIAGVVVGSIAFVILALVVIPGVVILLQARKNNKIPLKLNDKRISISKFSWGCMHCSLCPRFISVFSVIINSFKKRVTEHPCSIDY